MDLHQLQFQTIVFLSDDNITESIRSSDLRRPHQRPGAQTA